MHSKISGILFGSQSLYATHVLHQTSFRWLNRTLNLQATVFEGIRAVAKAMEFLA